MEPRFWAFEAAPQIENWKVDGLITQARTPQLLMKLCELGKPAVNVANHCAIEHAVPTVLPDDIAIGEMAAEYLLSLGIRHFGFCTAGRFEYGRLRGEAFKSKLAAKGAACHQCDTDKTTLASWLTSLPTPIAIFCCNDAWAH